MQEFRNPTPLLSLLEFQIKTTFSARPMSVAHPQAILNRLLASGPLHMLGLLPRVSFLSYPCAELLFLDPFQLVLGDSLAGPLH